MTEQPGEEAVVVDTSWRERPLEELVDHIIEVFHRPLEKELPSLVDITRSVRERHSGADRAEDVGLIHEAISAIWSELENHLHTEEQVVFPWILSRGEGADGAEAPISVILHEHVFVYRALDRIRDLTGGFEAFPVEDPEGAALVERLALLDRDLRRHQRLEEEVLFPRALGREL